MSRIGIQVMIKMMKQSCTILDGRKTAFGEMSVSQRKEMDLEEMLWRVRRINNQDLCGF